MMENTDMMNVTEVSRLTDWLKHYGVPAEKILECIDYIATNPQLPESSKKKEPKPNEATNFGSDS